MNVFQILILVAGGLAIFAMVKPAWPLCAVAVLLVCVALFTGKL